MNRARIVEQMRSQPIIPVLIAVILVICLCGAGVILARPLLSRGETANATQQRVQSVGTAAPFDQPGAPDLTATAFFAPLVQNPAPTQAAVAEPTQALSPVATPGTGLAPAAVAPQGGTGGSTGAAWRYRVQRGDTLWSIAQRFCGSGYAWRTIYQANKPKLTNYRLIYTGQVLEIRCP